MVVYLAGIFGELIYFGNDVSGDLTRDVYEFDHDFETVAKNTWRLRNRKLPRSDFKKNMEFIIKKGCKAVSTLLIAKEDEHSKLIVALSESDEKSLSGREIRRVLNIRRVTKIDSYEKFYKQ